MEERIYDITITSENGVEEVTIVTLPQFLHSTLDCLESEYEGDVTFDIVEVEEVPV